MISELGLCVLKTECPGHGPLSQDDDHKSGFIEEGKSRNDKTSRSGLQMSISHIFS